MIALGHVSSARRPGIAWIVLAGMTAGVAWTVRYAAVALAVASLAYLMLQAWRWSPRRVVASLGAWVAGWGFGAAGLVVHNLFVFGSIQPYRMPPSDRSLLTNLSDAWRVICKEVAFCGDLRRWLVTNPMLALTVVLACGLAALVVLVHRRGGRPSLRRLLRHLDHRRELLLPGIFFVVYTAMIVVARSKYQWGETINFRHFVPVVWMAQLAVFEAMAILTAVVVRRRRHLHVVLTVVVAVMALVQLQRGVERIGHFREIGLDSGEVARSRALVEAAKLVQEYVPPDRFVLSDKPFLLRIFGDVAARRADLLDDEAGVSTSRRLRMLHATPNCWGVVALRPERWRGGEEGPVLARLVRSPVPGLNLLRAELDSPSNRDAESGTQKGAHDAISRTACVEGPDGALPPAVTLRSVADDRSRDEASRVPYRSVR